jgi:integrase
LRAGELFGLRRARIDVLHATVDVAEVLIEVSGHHHFGPPKTRAGRRRAPLPRFVADELAAHVAGLEPDALVFPAPRGGPVRALHDLPHTAVAMWIAAGASPNEVAARAGHTSTVTVLDRYGHLLPGQGERVTDALDAMARDAQRSGDAVVRPLRQVRPTKG